MFETMLGLTPFWALTITTTVLLIYVVLGRLRVIAAITEPNAIQQILDHVHQQQAPPRLPPSRVYGPITTEIQFDVS